LNDSTSEITPELQPQSEDNSPSIDASELKDTHDPGNFHLDVNSCYCNLQQDLSQETTDCSRTTDMDAVFEHEVTI